MTDVDNKVKIIVEGLLLAAGRPLSLDNIAQIFAKNERPDKAELKAVMQSITKDCADRGFELKEIATGFRFQVKQDLSEWIAKLWEERPPRYTRALLETLALITYRQPITRGDIEEIRGVGVSSNIIRTLLDREWVRVVGHRDVPGRPAMFATTKQFLDYFNLKSLQELPPLSEIKDLVKADPEFDLEDDLAAQRILDVPEDSEDQSSYEITGGEEQMLAEKEAAELSKKPLDEILADDPGRMTEEEIGEEDEEFRNSDENLEVDEINRRVEDAGSVIMDAVNPEVDIATSDSLDEIEDEDTQSEKTQQEDINQENSE
jgi:segregation and condensation protein B